MQLEVKIDQAAIEAQLVQTIINSSIGQHIEVAVKKLLTESSGGWHERKTLVERAVEEALTHEIRKMAIELVESKRDEIRAQMTEKLTDDVLQSMTNAAWEVMNGRLKSA